MFITYFITFLIKETLSNDFEIVYYWIQRSKAC